MFEAVCAVVEPDSQAHVAVGEDRRRDRQHVGERRVTEEDRVKALRNRDGHCGNRFSAARAGAVIAPKGPGSLAVDQGKLELPGAVEVDAIGHDAALEVDELGHLRAERGPVCKGEGDPQKE